MNAMVFINQLHKISLFSQLTGEQMGQLLRGAQLFTINRHTHLFHRGDKLSHFYWVESGNLRLYKLDHEGNEKVYQTVATGDLLAETIMFTQQQRAPLSAVAQEDTRIYSLPGNNLRQLAEQVPAFAMTLLQLMSSRLYQAVDRLDQLSVNSTSQRLVYYLAELYRTQQSYWLKVPVNSRQLANQLATSPEHLSRLLSRFKSVGVITLKKDGLIVLNDPTRLAALVGLPDDIYETPLDQEEGADGAFFRCCNFS